ncbi:MAG: hypothetical protein CL608_30780 [Anaerolineaceae bacterium]|nr:hypothetical protein [Anaerolineaceae bacterium]
MTGNPHALAARISRHLHDVEQVVHHSEEVNREAIKRDDKIYFEALALNLHSFYLGVERIFEDIARTIDQEIPAGSDWHRLLLQQMASDMPPVRPAIISETTYHCLDEFRRFRHVIRHGYTTHLKIKSVKELATSLHDCFTAVHQDLNNFIEFLHQLAND